MRQDLEYYPEFPLSEGLQSFDQSKLKLQEDGYRSDDENSYIYVYDKNKNETLQYLDMSLYDTDYIPLQVSPCGRKLISLARHQSCESYEGTNSSEDQGFASPDKDNEKQFHPFPWFLSSLPSLIERCSICVVDSYEKEIMSKLEIFSCCEASHQQVIH